MPSTALNPSSKTPKSLPDHHLHASAVHCVSDGPSGKASEDGSAAHAARRERAESPAEPAQTVPGPQAEILTQGVGMWPRNLPLSQVTGETTPGQRCPGTRQHPRRRRTQVSHTGMACRPELLNEICIQQMGPYSALSLDPKCLTFEKGKNQPL